MTCHASAILLLKTNNSVFTQGSSKQPCDFRNQIPQQQQALQPTAQLHQLHQLHSKPFSAFIWADGYRGSWRGQKQRVGLVRRCKLSTAAVHNGSLLQPNSAQTLAAIAVQLNAAASPAIFATNSLRILKLIS